MSKHGVKTDFGKRNKFFIDARKAARHGDRDSMTNLIQEMNKIQPLTKREREAIEKNLPERRQPAPR